MKLPSFFLKQPWPYTSCQQQPRTLSFRGLPAVAGVDGGEASRNSAESPSYSTESDRDDSGGGSVGDGGDEGVEMVIRGLKATERLFFEPGGKTSSIVEAEIAAGETAEEEASCGGGRGGLGLEEGSTVIMSMDSEEPYMDFRRSMEEMVEAHGLKEWAHMEELLGWYLRANGKINHGYIVAAFVDLLVGLAFANSNDASSSSSSTSSASSSSSSSSSCCSSSSSCSLSSPLSFSSCSSAAPCFSSLEAGEKQKEEEEEDNGSSS